MKGGQNMSQNYIKVDFAVEHNVSVIVLGASPQDGADSFADKLALRLPDVELDVVRAARDR